MSIFNKEYRDKYYKTLTTKTSKANKLWYLANKEKADKSTKSWQEKNPIPRLYHNAKTRAAKCDFEFTITKDDIVVPKVCPYLGCELTSIMGQGRVWTNASIDRIDSSKGYIPGNVQVISDLANMMKSQATIKQLIAFAEGVLRLHGDAGIKPTTPTT